MDNDWCREKVQTRWIQKKIVSYSFCTSSVWKFQFGLKKKHNKEKKKLTVWTNTWMNIISMKIYLITRDASIQYIIALWDQTFENENLPEDEFVMNVPWSMSTISSVKKGIFEHFSDVSDVEWTLRCWLIFRRKKFSLSLSFSVC